MSIHLCLAFIGFGEAAMAFTSDLPSRDGIRAFDIQTADPSTSALKWQDYRALNVTGTAEVAGAVTEADIVVSLVTADQALVAARATAEHLQRGALYCDFNSVSPATKKAASKLIEAAGAVYVDVAIMAPVHPLRLRTPLLVSGPAAHQAAAALERLGFRPRKIGGPIGKAASIKMLRSVLIKGLEALSAECFLAAHAAGVMEEVAASLNTSWPSVNWPEKANYDLDRMMVHGIRRAAEMEEAARTLEELGVDSFMTRAAIESQRTIGSLGLTVPDELQAKFKALVSQRWQTS